MVLRPAGGSHYQRRADPDPRTVLKEVVAHLQAHFAGLDPKLGTVLRLRHGEGPNRVDLPLDGGNDPVHASTLSDVAPDGTLTGPPADSLLLFTTWAKRGVI